MILLLLACAPDLRDLDGDGILDVAVPDTAEPVDTAATDTAAPDDTAEDTGFTPTLTVTDEGGGVYLVEVNSNEGVSFVGFLPPEQTWEGGPWVMSFERYFFWVNGGESGEGSVEGVYLPDADFDSLTEAPTEGWTTDTDEGGVFDDWYVYDSVNHVLTAAPGAYALRDGAGGQWKLQFLDYYDAFGNTGYPSFRVAELEN